jgi:hypothetical protein
MSIRHASGSNAQPISALAFVFVAFLFVACAPTMPTFSGGRTTPHGKADTHLGGAYRIPLGSLASGARAAESPDTRGKALLGRDGGSPVAAARYGVRDDLDLGLSVSLTQVALAGRFAIPLDDIGRGRILVGVTPTAGWLGEGDVSGYSLGVQAPVVAAIQFSGVYEAWAGLRVGVDYASGTSDDSIRARVARGFLGGVLGFAVGFRIISVLAELAVDNERWTVRSGNERGGFSGVSLTPAFAVRLRL